MARLSTVKMFAEASPVSRKLLTAVEDYANQVRSEKGVVGLTFSTDSTKEQKDMAITKMFVEELERKTRTKAIEDFGSLVAFASNPQTRSMADLTINFLIDALLPNIKESGLGMIADFKFGGFNDSFKFTLKNNSLFAVSEAGRRQRTTPSQKKSNTEVTIDTYNHQITVATTLIELVTGRESLVEFIMTAIKSFQADMVKEVIDAFKAEFELATLPTALKPIAYSEEALITLCEKVSVYNGEKAIIVGSPLALKNVLPTATNVTIRLTDEYVTKGHLPDFNGYSVIAFEHIADYTTNDYSLGGLPDDRIYVISPSQGKLVKVAIASETIPSYTDANFANANLLIESSIQKEYGTAVITNAIAGAMAV